MTKRRRVGRPPLPEEQRLIDAKTTLPPEVFERLCVLARRKGLTPSALIRAAVLRVYRSDERGGTLNV